MSLSSSLHCRLSPDSGSCWNPKNASRTSAQLLFYSFLKISDIVITESSLTFTNQHQQKNLPNLRSASSHRQIAPMLQPSFAFPKISPFNVRSHQPNFIAPISNLDSRICIWVSVFFLGWLLGKWLWDKAFLKALSCIVGSKVGFGEGFFFFFIWFFLNSWCCLMPKE